MSKLLIPIHVDAKVIGAPTSVPTLSGAAFETGAPLETGVHLHWALPDALTRARSVEQRGSGATAVFPAVPDLWLIVRFQPLASASQPEVSRPKIGIDTQPAIRGLREMVSAPARMSNLRPSVVAAKRPMVIPTAPPTTKQPSPIDRLGDQIEIGPVNPGNIPQLFSARRDWTAWVLDSRTGTSVPLEQWQPPASRASGRLTAMGELPEADALGMPGWGRWDGSSGDKQAHTSAYYPSARKRFGFHDSLVGVVRNAEIGYAIIGWFADRNHDPLHRASDREALLERWAIAYEHGLSRSPVLSPAVSGAVADTWLPPSIKAATSSIAGPKLRMRELDTIANKRSVLDNFVLQQGPILGRQPPQFELRGPDEIVCHGAIVQVPTRAPATADAVSWDVRLSPSIKRATAELVADKPGDVLSVEALLQDLEGQARTVAGFLDVPAAMHALTFASAPGQSRWYAEVGIRAKGTNTRTKSGMTSKRAPAGSRATLGKDEPVVSAKLVGPQEGLSSRSGYPGVGVSIGKLLEQAQGNLPAKAPPPTDDEIAAKLAGFAATLRAAFKTACNQSAAAGKPLHPKWVRVVDQRRNAPPSKLDGLAGSASAGWWLDVNDDAHVRILLVASWAAQLDQPSAQHLYEKPGPRWYRPGAPQLVIESIDRAYRHGFDGRYEPDGRLACRLAGDTVTANNVAVPNYETGAPVTGAELITRASALAADKGLPSVTRGLIEEVLLLDPSNAGLLADNWLHHYKSAKKPTASQVRELFEACNLGWMMLRQPDLAALTQQNIQSALDFTGRLPSPIAIAPWQDPWLPLFVDVRYGVLPADLASQYALGEIELDVKPTPPAYPSSGAEQSYAERAWLTAALTRVAEGAVITKFGVDKYGDKVPMGTVQLDPDTFERTDVLSAALTEIDDRLRAANQHQRTGRMRVSEIAVVDTFGTTRKWTPPPQPNLDPRSSPATWLIGLSPRLPHWTRLMARFMSATHAGVEADYGDSPICGFMLPDHVEHALELFDGDGQAIGQLLSDPPVRGKAGPRTLGVRFEPHPWLEHQGPVLDAIANLHLREIVAGIVAQTTIVPPNAAAEQLYESGLTELLRLFDTVGGTVAWTGEHGDRNVKLFGKLVAIVQTKLWFETSAATQPGNDGQQHPPLPVQLGSITRPDDGVYGVFLPGQTPAAARFAPVDHDVLDNAVVNGLRDAVYGGFGARKLVHPFIADPAVGQSRFSLAPGQSREFSVFIEVGGAMYLTSGVVPRKKLTLDPWFIDAAVRHVEPTFAVGPVLAVPGLDGRPAPIMPHPDLAGYEEWWLERPEPGSAWDVQTLPELPAPGAIPRTRVVLTEGFVRLEPSRPDEP